MVDTAYIDNPNQIYDNLLTPTRLLIAAAIFVTVAFGMYYHYHIFQSAFGTGIVAVAGSLLWFLVIEAAKVFMGVRLARSITSGGWYSSWVKLIVTLLLAVIVGYAFSISIAISTKSVAVVNQGLRTEKLYTDNTFSPPPSITEIDRQIIEVESAINTAKKSTWKGRPTSEGLRLMEKNTSLKEQLVAQRNLEMANAQNAHSQIITARRDEISSTASQLATYGGIAEYVTMILIAMLALLERASYESNAGSIPQPSSPRLRNTEIPNLKNPAIAFSENSSPRKIGFQLPETKPETPETKHPETPETTRLEQPETKPEIVVATAFQHVPEPETRHLKQPETKVILHTEIRDDIERAVAEQIRNIQRYLSKWQSRGKGGGKPETILANIEASFQTIKTLQQEGDISAALKQKVAEYFSKLQQIKSHV